MLYKSQVYLSQGKKPENRFESSLLHLERLFPVYGSMFLFLFLFFRILFTLHNLHTLNICTKKLHIFFPQSYFEVFHFLENCFLVTHDLTVC